MKMGQDGVSKRTESFYNTVARTKGRRREPALNALPRDACFVETSSLKQALA